MLKSIKVFSSFSVDSLEKAKEFYGQTLGLEISKDNEMGLNLKLPDGTEIFVYGKPNHAPATFTILNFVVDNIDEAVDSLKAMGVKFEIYSDGPIKTDEKGVARPTDANQGPAIAWFKDPAGNFLSVMEGGM